MPSRNAEAQFRWVKSDRRWIIETGCTTADRVLIARRDLVTTRAGDIDIALPLLNVAL